MSRNIGALSIYCLATMFFHFPLSAHAHPNQETSDFRKVTVSAYTNTSSCTDTTPGRTASSLRIKPEHYRKLVALSPDLAKNYDFGDKFYLVVKGKSHLVEFQDIMPKKHKNKIDFLLPSKRECMKFGVTQGVLIPVDD
ncbi:hypothetical protein [Desulforhabdus amnigena]|uniref:Uncharacterized protein n=1 Tax=Desulforhabdus amnigena TaxID=40218 RepID=A0A9W6FSM7_9BACT|nr:hypothetical protein [Desulforhabdus amnigena]NLJ27777.1 hypothetical protein [Deltaproteobacteria bacterium]GLI34204.1 hypothetical protein DAMNIGENAA_16370 [Desulforhabdus amnigena]